MKTVNTMQSRPTNRIPPQNHTTISSPTRGIAVRKFVITVAAQRLICPQGNT